MLSTQLSTIGSGKLDHCYATCIGVVDDLCGDGVLKGRDLYKWGEVPIMAAWRRICSDCLCTVCNYVFV